MVSIVVVSIVKSFLKERNGTIRYFLKKTLVP